MQIKNKLAFFIFLGLLLVGCIPFSEQVIVTPEIRSAPTVTGTSTTTAIVVSPKPLLAAASITPIATETPMVTPTAVPTSTPIPTATITPTRYVLRETTSIDHLNPEAIIKIPFVRDGNIYLYEDGIEKLVAKSTQQTKIFYPLLSPNGKYLAYIEQYKSSEDSWDGHVGYLRIVDISTGIDRPTDYEIVDYFRWTSDNVLNFGLRQSLVEASSQVVYKRIFYDPETAAESLFETIIEKDSHAQLSAEYPSDNLNKLIRFKNNEYYLVDNTLNEETFLFDANSVSAFRAWSPGGRYAVFVNTQPPATSFEFSEFVFDTQNLASPATELTVRSGAAGGPPSIGHAWYFEKGFVVYCSEELYFVDGSPAWMLTNEGGGGCNNEEGFVATSPNGKYAFVKFTDRFELHDIDGNISVVQEIDPLAKGRWAPGKFIWLNDDYMIIFTNLHKEKDATVYIFDRIANTIKPLIENAYLIE